MALEPLEQAVRRFSGFLEVSHEASNAERHAFFVGINEAHAGHAARDGAGRLDHGAFIAPEIEAGFNGLTRQEVHFLAGQRDIVGLRSLAQIGPRPEQPVHAFGQHDHVGVHLPVVPVGTYADHPAIGVLRELRHGRLAQHRRARLPYLGREPLVELRANDGVTVRTLLVEVVGAIVQPDMGAVIHHPEALLDQMTFQWRILAKIRDQLLQHIGIEDRPLNVL
ncbi:hypothetical protein GALL_547730 [mine drainage metagenome]|uniref:Uncharacterized protein n=1 Tax=mine drainage metagenome TaxID=410659 RepID=A0A1J5NY29_9ZZZZ